MKNILPKFYDNPRYNEWVGLSTDDKGAIEGLLCGDIFIEIDTGNSFICNDVGNIWTNNTKPSPLNPVLGRFFFGRDKLGQVI